MGSFFKGFLLAGGIMLIAVASFNYLVDPYWFSERRINGFNDVRTDVLYAYAPVANVYRLSVKDPRAEFAIIGPSTILRGISGCNYPGLEKVTVSSMSLAESLQITKRIVREAIVKKTIFIEVSQSSPHKRASDYVYANLLSLRTAIHSLRVVRASYRNKARIICAPIPAETRKAGSVEDLIEGLTDLRTLNEDELLLMKKEVASLSNGRTKLFKHRIVFFTSPLPAEVMEREGYRETDWKRSQQMQTVVADMQRLVGDHIEVSFVSLKDFGIGEEYRFNNSSFYKGWYDAFHYKPVIGEQVLKRLFESVR